MNLIKLPHEISLWDDYLVIVDENGEEYEGFVDISKVKVSTQYYKERKLCIISSHTLESPLGAIEPKLVRKTDGTSTLTFSIYAKYYDEEEGCLKDNPFIQYLTNERKIKLKYFPNGEMRWLDFIIKKIDETSDNYKFTYTATDLFINELSKTGYNLVFDAQIENNQGTVNELGARVLENSDWSVGGDTEVIQQLKDEPLYEIKLNVDLIAYDIFTDKRIIIPYGKTIYAFYSAVNDQTSNYFQFIYDADNNYKVDENNVVYDVGNYYCIDAPIGTTTYTNIFRGERYIRSQETAFDSVLQRHVNVYEDKNGARVYGYVETEYTAPSLIASHITNGETIISASGWAQEKIAELEVDYDDEIGHFGIKFSQSEDNSFLMNTGFRDNAETIKEISPNQEFVCTGLCYGNWENRKPIVRVQKYKLEKGKITFIEDPILTFKWQNSITGPSYAKASRAVSYEELTDPSLDGRFGIFFSAVDSNGKIVKDDFFVVQGAIFEKQGGFAKNDSGEEEEGIILPGGKVYFKNGSVSKEIAKAIIRQKNHFYYPPKENLKPEQVEYLYIGEGIPNNYTPVYRKNFEKIRSISKKETNRFDLIQSLSETFECWARFDVWHKDTGEIMLGKDVSYLINSGNANSNEDTVYTGGNSYSIEDLMVIANDNVFALGADAYRQQKFVTFHKRIGQKKNIGFTYGINLKSISRSLDSNQIATKLIVKSNSNEFAEGGSCNIATAKENPSGENFVYDFTHYANQGLLHKDVLNYDLYSLDEERGWIGLYPRLKLLNNERDELIAKLATFTKQYSHNKSECETARVRISATEDRMREINAEYEIYKDSTSSKEEALRKEKKRLEVEYDDLLLTYENAKNDMTSLEKQTEEVNNRLRAIENDTAALINKFEQKYIRFIQEASWISEDYTDDNLYYIDAETTLHKSCQPKASYDIKIIELNQIEGYENYVFDLGDITYVQDPEFFGWKIENGLRTPYKEEIVITEQTIFFNEPDKSSIKAQNYRKAFEDLFQRLAASAQQLQFHSGEYARAANVVDSKGNILPKSLADAFANNAYVLSNTANQSVKWDEYGITTTNTANPAEIVRMTSGGVFLTGDGGESWTTGITAKGINAKTITTGQLDTGVVTIGNSEQKAFVWNSDGLNAYKKNGEDKYSLNEYVRFNSNGIEGKDESGNTTFRLSSDGLTLNKGTINWTGGGVTPPEAPDLSEYLGETTKVGDRYIVSPYIGGGYLKLSKDNSSVTIDPSGTEGKIFEIRKNGNDVLCVDGEKATFSGDLKVNTTYTETDSEGKDVTKSTQFSIDGKGIKFGDNFEVDSKGNVKVSGDITGSTGSFGGELKVGGENGGPIFQINKNEVKFGDDFVVDASGKLALEGQVIATSGTIGGWTLQKNKYGYELISGVPGTSGFIGLYTKYDTDDNYRLVIGSQFTVDNAGYLSCSGGNIGGINITPNGLSNSFVTIASNKDVDTIFKIGNSSSSVETHTATTFSASVGYVTEDNVEVYPYSHTFEIAGEVSKVTNIIPSNASASINYDTANKKSKVTIRGTSPIKNKSINITIQATIGALGQSAISISNTNEIKVQDKQTYNGTIQLSEGKLQITQGLITGWTR